MGLDMGLDVLVSVAQVPLAFRCGLGENVIELHIIHDIQCPHRQWAGLKLCLSDLLDGSESWLQSLFTHAFGPGAGQGAFWL